MLKDIMKTTAKLKKDIEGKIYLDDICQERELLISVHYLLEDIERKIDKGVNPQITKYYEEYPMDGKEDFKEVPTKPYYMKPHNSFGNGKCKLPQQSMNFNNVEEKPYEIILSQNVNNIPNYVPYEIKIPKIRQNPDEKIKGSK